MKNLHRKAEITIRLGYEIPTGDEVMVPLRHMAVTGQTQRSGKTTTLEALISRSAVTALAFITKRGEGSFADTSLTPVYFEDSAGGRPYWEFVESIVASTMGQKMKFERAWIVKAAKGAKTLEDVRANLTKLQAKSTRSMDQDIYMLLAEYLDIVLPQMRQHMFAKALMLKAGGLNVMDLTPFNEEMQMLIVRSCILWIHKYAHNVVTIVPEAWKFVPEGRMTPVKPAAERLVREGAGLGNFVWIDSQDIAGVSKLLLRAVTVWIIGVQREANEVKRTLANIPESIKRPKAADVAQLGIGEFFACHDSEIRRTYVQPRWLTDGEAYAVATGIKSVGDLKQPLHLYISDPPERRHQFTPQRYDVKVETTIEEIKVYEEESDMTKDEEKALREENERLQKEIRTLTNRINILTAGGEEGPFAKVAREKIADNDDAIYEMVRQRLIKDAPSILLKIAATKPELEITVERQTIEADGVTWVGRTASLIAEGYFDAPRKASEVFKEATRRGATGVPVRADEACKKLLAMGFLTREEDGFKAVKGMKINIVEV